MRSGASYLQGMRLDYETENRAIARLVEQIDSIEYNTNAVGRRIVYLFLAIFAFAVGLLFWSVTAGYDGTPRKPHPGPRVAGVLHGYRG
jgi:hypothetical protein